MDSHEGEVSVRGEEEPFNGPKIDPRSPWPALAPFSQSGLSKLRVWVRPKPANVSDAETLEAIKPKTIADKQKQEEHWADIDDVTSDRVVLEPAREPHQLLVPLGL